MWEGVTRTILIKWIKSPIESTQWLPDNPFNCILMWYPIEEMPRFVIFSHSLIIFLSLSLSLSLPVPTSHHHAIRDVINYQVDILSLPNISSDCYSSAFDSLELLSSRNETVFPADREYSTVEQELIWGWVADVFECFFSFRCFQVVYQRQTQGELSKGSSTSPTVNSNKVLRTRGESKLLCECMY